MIDGAELYRRGYRIVRDQGYCLAMPDRLRLKEGQRVSFTNGERATAAELAARLENYRPPLSPTSPIRH